MTRRSPVLARDGWTLSEERDDFFSSSSYDLARFTLGVERARYSLSGLTVTPAQAEQLLATRAVTLSSCSWHGQLTASDICLTLAETRAIARGRHPLNVLLPRYQARALTVAEMMAR